MEVKKLLCLHFATLRRIIAHLALLFSAVIHVYLTCSQSIIKTLLNACLKFSKEFNKYIFLRHNAIPAKVFPIEISI
jgi:hypothetical protein